MTKTEPIARDWQQDRDNRYAAHYNPLTGKIEGPEDAFIFYGLPLEGNPLKATRKNPYDGKEYPCEPYLDPERVSKAIGGVPVEWIAWDEETGCNVYKRLA